jgi:hypothetical protein
LLEDEAHALVAAYIQEMLIQNLGEQVSGVTVRAVSTGAYVPEYVGQLIDVNNMYDIELSVISGRKREIKEIPIRIAIESAEKALERLEGELKKSSVVVPAAIQKQGVPSIEAFLESAFDKITPSYLSFEWPERNIDAHIDGETSADFVIRILPPALHSTNRNPDGSGATPIPIEFGFAFRRGIGPVRDIFAVGTVLDEADVSGLVLDKIYGFESLGLFAIDLVNEALIVPAGYDINSYSVDGGSSWKNGNPIIRPGISRMLNKDSELLISNKPANSKAGPQKDETTITVRFPSITSRPKTRVRAVINYAADVANRDITGATSGTWALTQRGSSVPFVDSAGIQISEAAGRRFTQLRRQPSGSEARTWGVIQPNGVAVYELLGENRAYRQQYAVRIAPSGETGTSGTFIAAGSVRRINARSERVAPRLRFNAKRNLVNTKANSFVNGVLTKTRGHTPQGGKTIEVRLAATNNAPVSAPAFITVP